MAILSIGASARVEKNPPLDSSTILEISESGNSMIINRGTLEGIKVGDRGKFLWQESSDLPDLSYVAFGEAIKIFPAYSYWFLRRIENPDKLQKGRKLIFVNLDDIMDGRRPLRILQRNVILKDKKDQDDFLDETESVPYSLVYNDDYEDGEEMVKTKISREHDMETSDFDVWSEGESEYFKEFGEEVRTKAHETVIGTKSSERIRRKKKSEIFDAVVDKTMENVNQDKRSVEEQHALRQKESSFSEKTVYQETYESWEREEPLDPGAVRKLERDGSIWSADMNDDQLRRFVLSSGIAREKLRQKYALQNRFSNEIILRYSRGMIDNTNVQDENNRGVPSSYSAGYEYHLGRTSEYLNSWSAEAFYSVGTNYYDVHNANASAFETTYKFALNWYFLNEPSAINKYMCYIGSGMRFGSAELAVDSLYDNFSYQIYSFPSYHLGIKYRLNAGDEFKDKIKLGIGLNFLASYEMLSMTLNETQENDVWGKVEIYDLRFALGLSFYF